MKNDFEPERILEILEKISKTHSSESEECRSIELAAKAILFIHASGQHSAFRGYLESLEKNLTPEQKSFLAAIGLE